MSTSWAYANTPGLLCNPPEKPARKSPRPDAGRQRIQNYSHSDRRIILLARIGTRRHVFGMRKAQSQDQFSVPCRFCQPRSSLRESLVSPFLPAHGLHHLLHLRSRERRITRFLIRRTKNHLCGVFEARRGATIRGATHTVIRDGRNECAKAAMESRDFLSHGNRAIDTLDQRLTAGKSLASPRELNAGRLTESESSNIFVEPILPPAAALS